MKKYCLTQCFKNNVSQGMQNVIDVLSFILVMVIVVTGAIAISAIIGIAMQFLIVWINPVSAIFQENPVAVGFMTLVLLLMLTIVVKFTYDFLSWIIKNLFWFSKNIVTNVVAPEQAECRIFEECKE